MLYSQKDTAVLVSYGSQRGNPAEITATDVLIYPVPVKDNRFTIKSEKKISSVKVSNIIGQEIFRSKYSDPQQITKIILDNARRGMYLVTIVFSDDTRIVKKIMVEVSN
jgi:hypothetical protein